MKVKIENRDGGMVDSPLVIPVFLKKIIADAFV
jgi:hypothetical protein